MADTEARATEWLKVVSELSRLATKRGVPVMTSCGDVDEIYFLAQRLRKFRLMERGKGAGES